MKQETRETPWLKPRVAYGDLTYGTGANHGAWICAKDVRRLFNIPSGRRIKIVVSDKPVRGAIRGHLDLDGFLEMRLRGAPKAVLTFVRFAYWLGVGEHWGWVEYEHA